jgi:uncharacterized protein (DUF2062 family)
MPRRWLKRFLPQRHTVDERWFLRPFRALLHDPALWALHRRNVLRATTVGIVSAFVPIPGQTALAGLLAVYFRVNIPIALLASMVSNPVTMGPLYYGAYRLGLVVLGERASAQVPALPLESSWSQLGDVVAPLLIGCALFAAVFAAVAWLVINRLWVSAIRRQLRRRAAERSASGGSKTSPLEGQDAVHAPGDREVVSDHD